MRLLVVLAGMPEPHVDIQITDGKGYVRRRLDLGYERHLIGLEYEGRQLVVAKGIFGEPETTLDRLVRLLRSRG